MLREDMYAVSVTVAGVSLGVFDKMSGAEGDSEETLYRPGGLAQQIPLGGAKTIGNATVSKIYDAAIHTHYPFLMGQRGHGEMVIARQGLDNDGHASGAIVTISGVLKSVKQSDIDSESNNASMIELEMTVRSIN